MKPKIFAALLATGLGTAAAAGATPVTGIITSISDGAATVHFAGGASFTFPDGPRMQQRLSEFRPGELVTIDRLATDKPWNADQIDLARPFGTDMRL